MTNFSELRVFLCMTPTSMNFSFDRLMGLAERIFNQDPLSGHLFLFINRYRNRIKIFWWDGSGFYIAAKRMRRGGFDFPKNEGAVATMSLVQLAILLKGVDFTGPPEGEKKR